MREILPPSVNCTLKYLDLQLSHFLNKFYIFLYTPSKNKKPLLKFRCFSLPLDTCSLFSLAHMLPIIDSDPIINLKYIVALTIPNLLSK